MGLLKSLVLLPLAPVEGVVWVAQQIQSQVDREMLGPEALLEELSELQAALEAGVINEDQYVETETELLDRLEQLEEAT
jgi:hypothetical protein